MQRLLLELGAPDDRILIEDQARNTRQSAILCTRMLRARGDVGAVIVCTSRYHMRRCRMLLRMSGIRASAGVASEDAAFLGWVRHAYARLREMAAIPADAIRLAWHRLLENMRRS